MKLVLLSPRLQMSPKTEEAGSSRGNLSLYKSVHKYGEPGDLNQGSFPGPSVNSIAALRCFRQALGRLQLINTALVTFSINRINRLIGQSRHAIITFAIMLFHCS